MKKPLLHIVVGMFFLHSAANAEPVPTVSYFMDTPISRFSFGLFRLEILLNAETTTGRLTLAARNALRPSRPNFLPFGDSDADNLLANAFPYFEWEKNKIVISVEANPNFDAKEPNIMAGEAISICNALAETVRYIGGVNPETGKPEYGHSKYANLFSEIGFSINTEEDHLKKLDEIFEIEIFLPQWSCNAPLMSSKISLEKAHINMDFSPPPMK